MNTTPAQPTEDTPRPQPNRRGRWSARWPWQAMVAVLLVLIVANGQAVPASYAASGLVARAADAARRVATATPVSRPAASPSPSPVAGVDSPTLGKADLRPDFQVEFVRVDDGKAGTPLTYTVQVRNEGEGSGAATVNTIVPPELSNVRVTAPGFACTRRFSASGPQAGTVVSCTRSELDAGAAAEMTIEANAPSAAAVYQLTATADPRNEIAETDESNNDADATIRVRA